MADYLPSCIKEGFVRFLELRRLYPTQTEAVTWAKRRTAEVLKTSLAHHAATELLVLEALNFLEYVVADHILQRDIPKESLSDAVAINSHAETVDKLVGGEAVARDPVPYDAPANVAFRAKSVPEAPARLESKDVAQSVAPPQAQVLVMPVPAASATQTDERPVTAVSQDEPTESSPTPPLQPEAPVTGDGSGKAAEVKVFLKELRAVAGFKVYKTDIMGLAGRRDKRSLERYQYHIAECYPTEITDYDAVLATPIADAVIRLKELRAEARAARKARRKPKAPSRSK
jgi:hypothetical protein